MHPRSQPTPSRPGPRVPGLTHSFPPRPTRPRPPPMHPYPHPRVLGPAHALRHSPTRPGSYGCAPMAHPRSPRPCEPPAAFPLAMGPYPSPFDVPRPWLTRFKPPPTCPGPQACAAALPHTPWPPATCSGLHPHAAAPIRRPPPCRHARPADTHALPRASQLPRPTCSSL